MAGRPASPMVKLVDRKPLVTTTSLRRLQREEAGVVPREWKGDYALEIAVACTERRPDPRDRRMSPFEALLDTGFTGRAAISQMHYEYYCGAPTSFDELPNDKLTFFDGSVAENARKWLGDLWVLPQGVAPDVKVPVKVPRGKGIVVVPQAADDACVGMLAFCCLCARLQIDFTEGVFSVLIPKALVPNR